MDSSLGDVDSSPRPAGMLHGSLSSRHFVFPTCDVMRTTGLGRKGSQNIDHHAATEPVLKNSVTIVATEVQMPEMASLLSHTGH